ncbi:MAG: DNA polymerase III subunit gamma/tau [Chlamydiales bacterium]|nr:DNA polymerase III subunit gamma/tau [Chlamydiales bacterium]
MFFQVEVDVSENPQPKSLDYQVIARKFRPQTFSAVLGQDPIVTTLKNALKQNRLAHAYLFCGCRGTGKTTLARIFAKALNCQKRGEDAEPCNGCPSCLEILSGRSLDVLEIDGASNRGIDDIREINETIGYAPSSGRFKIYIIDEVHMLTKEAFNALLKTLEEPPSHVKFFFATTEPHKILPTIVSRCQRFDLHRISQQAMEQKLGQIAEELGIECDLEAFSLLSNLSEGSLRDAESLFDQIICCIPPPISVEKICNALGLMSKDAFFALDEAIAEQKFSFAFTLSEQIFSSGKDLSYFLDHLLEHFRTLLLMKYAQPSTFLNAHQKKCYKRSSELYTEDQCLYILDYLIQWQQQISKSPFKRTNLEMVLLHLIRSKHRISFTSLVQKLSELQSRVALNPPPEEIPPQKPQETLELLAEKPPVVFHPTPSPLPFEKPKPLHQKSTESPKTPIAEAITPPSLSIQSRYDTLIRFAAVELEGIIKNEPKIEK